MIIRKALVALASAGAVIGSTAAAAEPAPATEDRIESPISAADSLRGAGLWMLAIIIAIGVIGVLTFDSDEPASP